MTGRAIGKFLTLSGCSRGNIGIPTDYVQADASTRLSKFYDTFCSWRERFGTKPVENGSLVDAHAASRLHFSHLNDPFKQPDFTSNVLAVNH